MNEPLTIGILLSAGAAVLGFTLRWIFAGTVATIEKVAERVETMTSTVVSHGNSIENHGRRISDLEAAMRKAHEDRSEDRERLAQLEVVKPTRNKVRSGR